MRKGFFVKIWLLAAFCSVLSSALAFVAVANYYIDKEKERLIKHNELLAQMISNEVESGYLKGMWPYKTLKMVAESQDTSFLWIVTPKKEVFWANEAEMMGKVIDEPLLGVVEMSSRDALFDKEKIKIIAHPLKIELKEDAWTVLMGVSFRHFKEFQREIFFFSSLFFLFIVLLIGLISYYFSKKMTSPLDLLAKEMENFGSKGIASQVKIKTGDEIENLAHSFNKMAEDLIASRQSLEESKEVLEVRVDARTKELRELADSLEKTVQERTKELQERVDELERFYRLTVGRELKMKELKKRLGEKRTINK